MARFSRFPFFLAVFVTTLLWSPGGLAAGNLCTPEEKVLFACSTRNRLVSVCAESNLGEKAGYLQFRYGRPDKLEIAWPEASYPRQYVTKGELFYAGQVGQYLRFRMDRTSFLVFNVKGRDSGLVIEQDRTILEKQLCHETSVARLKGIPVPISEVLAVSGLSTK